MSITMQITTKGQVTIPREIRDKLGLLPHTKVEFILDGDHARLRKVQPLVSGSDRARMAIELLSGSGDVRMSTDEILALMRGGSRPTSRRK